MMQRTQICALPTLTSFKICMCAARECAVRVSLLSNLYLSCISCLSPLGEVSVLPVISGLEEWSDSVGQVGWNSLFI